MTIYNWNELSVSKSPDANGKFYRGGEELMPPEIQRAKITDAATGEEVPEVTAYCSERKLVDRVVLDKNGQAFVRADFDGIAMVTEFRELVITPQPVSAEDAAEMMQSAAEREKERNEYRSKELAGIRERAADLPKGPAAVQPAGCVVTG